MNRYKSTNIKIDIQKETEIEKRSGGGERLRLCRHRKMVRGRGADFHVDKNCKNLHTLAELKNILCFARSHETWKNF